MATLFRKMLYVLALVIRLLAGEPEKEGSLKLARLAWTWACVLLFVHVGFAFDGFHHWSHRAACEDTARQTKELVGWNWGGGLFINYIMLLVWLADVLWWWRGFDRHEARSLVARKASKVSSRSCGSMPRWSSATAGFAGPAWLVL